MMLAVEMYIIITITLVTTTQASLQTCFNYCKLSPEHSSIPRPECACYRNNARKTRSIASNLHKAMPEIKDSGIYYEPAKLNSSQNTSFDEQKFYLFNVTSSLHSQLNTHNNTKYKEHRKTFHTSESLAEQDTIYQNSNFSHKYKRRDNFFQKMGEEANDIPLHLYLDIDLHTSEKNNRSHLEELKNMFENFQASENDLSECINFHIYIFSKYIDTINKTSTNWGRKVDNLSSSQEITEIQKKCGQPASIIKQSIYQIKQSFPQKEQTSEIEHDEQMDEKNESESSNKNIVAQSDSRNFENSTIHDLYTTLTTYPADEVYNDTLETNIFSGKTTQVPSDKQYTEQDALNSFNNDNLSDESNSAFNSTSPILNSERLLNTRKHNTIEEPIATDITKLSGNENLRTTSKTNRTVYGEEEIQIPRITTKEFPNGTLMSVIDGHEEIPNSDFITSSIIPTDSDESTISYSRESLNESAPNPDLPQANNDNTVKSDLIEMQGNLYFLFGQKQIPARFIQQPDGELNVAIDGFSLCGQVLEENTSKFMNLLCNCIQLENCTYSSL